jgi:CBS domain-containing protein
MSPRAAWRLNQLGFDRSYDYVGGKLDWLSFDLPWQGTARLVARELDRTPSTCNLGGNVGEFRALLSSSPPAVVLFEDGVVAGILEENALDADDDQLVDEVMRPAPATIRPSEEVEELQRRVRRDDLSEVIVTRPDGRLVGIYRVD